MRNAVSTAVLGAVMLTVGLSGCSDAGKRSDAKADVESIKQAIKADEAKWQADLKRKDNEALVQHYADGAYFVTPAGAAEGSTPIRKVFAEAGADPAFAIDFASDKISVAASGDMAYSRGHFTERYTDRKSGKVMTDSGSYLSVYTKQSDGSWKVVEDFAVADPSTVKAMPPEKPATRAKMVSF